MSNCFTKIAALVAFTCMSLVTQAQNISVGANQINFGPSCYQPFIQATNPTPANGIRMAFGYNQFCVGPAYSLETIWMTMDPARLGIGVSSPSYQIQLSQNSAGKPGSSSWTVVSDARFKQDVRPYADGLSLIRGINPVYFHYNEASGYDSKPEYVGVLAQELQRVAPYMVRNDVKVDDAGNKTDYLAVDLGAMDFALVNAIKELDTELQAARTENAALQSTIAGIQAELAAMKSSLKGTAIATPSLQVSPNPIQGEATVRYNLSDHSGPATLEVLAANGTRVGTVALGSTREGSTTLKAGAFPQGVYIVKLVVNGQTIATQRVTYMQ